VRSVMPIDIGAASRDCARLVLDWLAEAAGGRFILNETSAGPGTAYLRDQLRRAGYAVIKTSDDGGERGSALISRVQIRRDLTLQIAGVSPPTPTSGPPFAV
jgi:exodeoxyribonuclease III